MFAVSFATLTPLEAGIKYNNNLVVIDETKLYNNGRHFIGLGLSFIKFPLTMQTITWSDKNALTAWSKEGQLITLDCAALYRLQQDGIINLFKRYGDDEWILRLRQIAVRILKRVTIQYTAVDFFENRRKIEDHMRADLRARFQEEWVRLEIFSLRSIDVPDEFERKILNKLIWAQQQQTALQIKQTQILRAKINVMEGQGNATVNLTIANARASQAEAIQQARALAASLVTRQEAASFANASNILGFNGSEVVQYRLNQLLQSLDKRDSKFLLGLQSSLFNVDLSPRR